MRIGIDLGGTKIEGVVMDEHSKILARYRVSTPQNDYHATLAAIVGLVNQLESGQGACSVGIAHPGSLSPRNGLMRNANSTCLNGQPVKDDLQALLQREIRMANDANCFALSEASDGAAAHASSVFGVIIGTGCGGGLVVNRAIPASANGISGEWGHNPLPWPNADWDEVPGPSCWHGLPGCLETWLSGPALSRDHGGRMTVEEISQAAENGSTAAEASLKRYEHRLARSLASAINLLDPQVIVLGGGLSNLIRLYSNVPLLWGEWVFSDSCETQLLPASHGDSSGVRGAAWLWEA
jgi:fructokinase